MKAPPCPFNEIVGKIQVLTLEVRTAMPMERVVDRLKGFFGEGGLGLQSMETDPRRLLFEGGGGHVAVDLRAEGAGTLMKITTSGWAPQVKRLVDGLP